MLNHQESRFQEKIYVLVIGGDFHQHEENAPDFPQGITCLLPSLEDIDHISEANIPAFAVLSHLRERGRPTHNRNG